MRGGQQPQPPPPPPLLPPLPPSNNSSTIELDRNLKSKQDSLTNTIKKIDSIPQAPSYQGSKLYKPSSFMTRPVQTQQQQLQQQTQQASKCNTLPISHTAHELTCYSNQDNLRQTQTLSKSKQSLSNGKFNKRFGLSPRFKRKIVETITNRVSFVARV